MDDGVFPSFNNNQDKNKIDKITAAFFDVFTNKNEKVPNLKQLKELFISNGIIINNTTGTPAVFDLDGFIVPREKILSDGTLTDFSEGEISSKTQIFENIAQRFSFYQKSGRLNGVYFESKGMKTIQFVKVNRIWKISTVAWSDQK